MGYSIEFELPGLPPLQVAGSGGGHWRTRHAVAKRWKSAVRRAVLADGRVPEKPLDRVEMLCERHSTREPDYDNLVASFKPIRDGLVEMGLLIDDKPTILVKCEHRWVKASRGAGKVRILLRAASDD